MLVISNNNGNHHSSILIVAPITTRGSHRMMLTHVKLQRRVKTLEGTAYVMLEQIRAIDKVRIVDFLGTISRKQMADVEVAILISLGLFHSRITERRDSAVEKMKLLKGRNNKIRDPDDTATSTFNESSSYEEHKSQKS